MASANLPDPEGSVMNWTTQKHDDRHGSPYDRGSADSYYSRPYNPHYYKGATYSSDRVGLDDMTAQEILAYYDGYYDNEKLGDKKDWG
jgi:hypothetical protein